MLRGMSHQETHNRACMTYNVLIGSPKNRFDGRITVGKAHKKLVKVIA